MENGRDRMEKEYEGAAIEAWAPGEEWQNVEKVRKDGL